MPGTFSYKRADGTTDLQTLHTCDITTGFADDMSSFSAGNDFTDNRKQGSNLIEFDYSSSNAWRYIRRVLTVDSAIDWTANDFTWWFYYTAKSEQVLGPSDSIVVRVYSTATAGTDYVEWELTGHTTDGLFPALVASWNRFICSGDNPTTVGGTGATLTAVRVVEVRFYFTNPNTQNGDPDLAIDWWKSGNTVQVTAGTSASPADIESLSTWDAVGSDPSTDPGYGLIGLRDVFIELWNGMQFGDGTTATYFAVENTFVFNNQFSVAAQHDWRVKNNATLRVGKKDVQTQGSYAVNGCSLVTPDVAIDGDTDYPMADFIVEGGSSFTNKLLAYASKFYRWKDVFFGLAAGSAGEIDLIDCDFDTCENIEFRSSTLKIKDCKFHDPTGDGYIGTVYVAPQSIDGIQVFNCTRGFYFKATMEMTNYVATDNTYDLVVDDGLTVTLVNSTFDKDKILQV